ncbi:hypothetical protein Ahy_B05g074855 [Arachis hypogaea]|uniref:Aminotransferase-like plant mobile domain-containing protein n=1 Tax=Arachis hypogaea TaxID=3818 RepID=A0A444YZZ7_ARAHY|nr:hypothetical protein Ahy_B05g074855 [Arachis hypogaea]
MDPRILSRVPADFLGHPYGDFYTAVVPLIFFRWIEILNVDRVLRQFGRKQGPPNPPLNIDTFHRQSARNDVGWWPARLSEWFEVWENRRSVLEDTPPPIGSTGVGETESPCRGCISGTASTSSPLNSSMSSSSELSGMPTSGCLSNPSKVEVEGRASRRFAFCSRTTNALKFGLRALLVSGPGTKSATPRFLTPSTLLELDELPPIS